MPLLPKSRAGSQLKIKQYPVEFNFWPVYQSGRRDGLESKLFVSNPWAIIRSSINSDCPASSREQALAFLEQAEYYFRTANNSDATAAKPVLLYYSFLNLVKAFVLKSSTRKEYSYEAYHGLKVKLGALPGTTSPTNVIFEELIDTYLSAIPSKKTQINIFDDFYKSFIGSGLSATHHYPLKYLLPQILQGHRLWCRAKDETERFIAIQNIELKNDPRKKEVWINIRINESELNRYGLSHRKLLEESLLKPCFREVRVSESKKKKQTRKPKLIKFEMITPLKYTHRASDVLQSLVDSLKGKIWVNVLSTPPYRKYYLYRAPVSEQVYTLPQLLSVYAFFFYLSSVTRYRPQMFADIVSGPYGALIQEATGNLPNQFLYLMASNFARREITKGAFV